MSVSSSHVPSLRVALLQSNRRSHERYGLRAPVVRIGRGVLGPHDIQLPLDDLRASREHARLVFEDGAWFLEDCSRNGTMVNGRLLRKERARLSSGDTIRIGDSFDVVFCYLSDTMQAEDGADVALRTAPSAQPAESPAVRVGLWISPSATVWRDGKRLPAFLSHTEYRLMKYLMQHANDVCDYDTVIQAVWGGQRHRDSLHELIYRVRRKIEPDPARPRYLIIRSGLGVVLFPQGVSAEQDAFK
ncbi:FHA domain-containing protein [Candidatus Roseilinea sp. NK_OTU-006]|jgi:hypothetical protein|nr:FHA domain-containing protein [Candidatus Roseilinea sp. NK_OTU-006]